MSLLRQMIEEEWRMHSRLFGSTGLLLFPVVILLLTLGTVGSLRFLGVPNETLLNGMQVMLVFFGLNVGTVGFVSRDAIKNVLGETNLLIFSSRTLPLSRMQVLGTFLLKDMLYYTFLFITPIIVGMLPVILERYGLLGVPFILSVAIGSFMLGVAVTLVAASLYSRSKMLLGGFLIGLAALYSYFRIGLLAFTPLGFMHRPTPGNLFFGFAPILILVYIGLVTFRPRSGTQQRRYSDLYSRLSRVLGEDHAVTAKSVLDIHRSSGSIWKILLSTGVLFGFFLVLVTRMGFGQRFLDAPGFSFAVLLSLAAIPVYNWVNRFDSGTTYRKLPLNDEHIFRAKFYAFLLLGMPVNYLFLLAGAWQFGVDGLRIGIILLPLLSIYNVGVVAYIGGLEPNKSLLRMKNFVVFTAAIAAVTVPLFVFGIFYRMSPDYLGGLSVLVAALAGLIGYRAMQQAASRHS